VCVFVALRYAACSARALYCHLWSIGCTVFSTLSHKHYDFQKKGIVHEMCFDFLYTVCMKRFTF